MVARCGCGRLIALPFTYVVTVMPVPRARFIPVESLPDSVRGEGGFGSTGYHGGASEPPASAGESSREAPRDRNEKDGILA